MQTFSSVGGVVWNFLGTCSRFYVLLCYFQTIVAAQYVNDTTREQSIKMAWQFDKCIQSHSANKTIDMKVIIKNTNRLLQSSAVVLYLHLNQSKNNELYINYKYNILFEQVAIVLLAVVAAVAADTYEKNYKPVVYAAPVYTKPAVYTVPAYTSKPVYNKEQSYAKETTYDAYEAPKEVYVAKEPVYKAAAYSAAPAYKPSYNSYKEESYVIAIA